jgi:hypothetical protein
MRQLPPFDPAPYAEVDAAWALMEWPTLRGGWSDLEAAILAELAASHKPATPALRAWLRRGDMGSHDALWRASCWEKTGLDRHYTGDPRGCAEALARADRIMHEAGPQRTPPQPSRLAGGWGAFT